MMVLVITSHYEVFMPVTITYKEVGSNNSIMYFAHSKMMKERLYILLKLRNWKEDKRRR